MKKILITGADSYIGTSFENYIKANYSDDYIVDTVDMLSENWREKSFDGYDGVFHVAGIAHQKETKENAHLYYRINRDLAVEIARKAKREGVRQFVFLSSMSVYGMETGVITKQTKPEPVSHYGKSKWQAEQELSLMASDNFLVCMLRAPMVYGKGCKGNFQTVVKLVKKSPVFPCLKNERSMIYIDNLSSFVKLCFDRELSGVYFPQNREYVTTWTMAKGIASVLNKKIAFSKAAGLVVALLRLFLPVAKKGFGTLVYKDTEDFSFSYITVDNEKSFELSIL